MYQADVIFKPMMPISSSAAKMSRPAVAGSLNKMMPTITDHGAQRANTGPDRISRTKRQCFGCACQQEKAHRHAGEREQ